MTLAVLEHTVNSIFGTEAADELSAASYYSEVYRGILDQNRFKHQIFLSVELDLKPSVVDVV